MTLQASAFLQAARPGLEALVRSLDEKYEYVSVLGTDVAGAAYVVHSGGMALKPSPDQERGFVVRVQSNVGFTEYSFNVLNVEEVIKKVDELVTLRRKMLETAEALPYPGVLPDEPAELESIAEADQAGAALTSQEILDQMLAVREAVQKAHPEVVNVLLSVQQTQVNKLFLSTHRDLYQSYQYSIAVSSATARRGDVVRNAFNSASGAGGLEILSRLGDVAEQAAKTAEELLSAQRIQPGEYDILSDPDFTGLIAHEAFGHGTEMDMFVKHRAKGAEYLDKRVASDAVRMHDGAAAYDEVSSYAFDDEGNLAQDTLIIEDGFFRHGMADAISALYLGVPATGNGKRESYARKAYTRMTNTFFEAGETPLEDLMAGITHGYLLEGLHSGMEDPKNWGIQCVASHAREIKDGKLTGKVVAPVYLTGYVPELLESITGASPDLELSGSGYCGKGWKEWVKTSTGGAYIKAKGRLS